MTIHIRPMTVNDLETVIDIDQRAFSLPWPPRAFGEELRRDTSLCLVATNSADTVVGFLVAWIIVDEIHIATIASDPDHQRQGIARQLLHTALTDASQRGLLSALLEVRETNTAAIALYRRFGFTEVGRRPHYYRDTDEAAILMTAQPIKSAPE